MIPTGSRQDIIVKQVEPVVSDGPSMGWQHIYWYNSWVGIPPIEHTIKPGDKMTLWFSGKIAGALLYFRINDGPITQVVLGREDERL